MKQPDDLSQFPDPSEASLKNSAQRIQAPIRVNAWPFLEPSEQRLMLDFHQHCLNSDFSARQIGELIDVQRGNAYKIIHGTYEAKDWSNILDKIRGYMDSVRSRESEAAGNFVENRPWATISATLDWPLSNGTMSLIQAESRMGKTACAREWLRRMGAARAVMVEPLPIGGARALLGKIANAVGISHRKYGGPDILMRLARSFDSRRVLIVDEAGRIMPRGTKRSADALEVLRYLHDLTGCGICLIVTERAVTDLVESQYQFEQVIGRIGLASSLPELKDSDILPMIAHFGKFDGATVEILLQIARDPGRLGAMVSTLESADRIARYGKQTLSSRHVREALRKRAGLQGKNSAFKPRKSNQKES